MINNTTNVNGVGIEIGDQGLGGTGTIVENNTANNNEGDGIRIAYTGHTIKRNTANNNGNWGIYAATGIGAQTNVDGGGNSATDNIQPAQCFGVRCDGSDAPTEQVPPDTLILRGPTDPTTSSEAVFRFTGSDNVSLVHFECSLDSAVYTACTSPATYPGITVGGHTLLVRAIDASGNIDPTPADYTWTRVGVDRAAGDDHRLGARPRHGRHRCHLHVLLERARRDVPVRPRRRRIGPVHVARYVHRPRPPRRTRSRSPQPATRRPPATAGRSVRRPSPPPSAAARS